MASSLSSVPPVCPSPRPDIIGTQRAAGRGERRENQRRLVADAAGAVLVDRRARDARIVHAHARADHRVGERRGLLGGHAAEQDRHQQRRGLVVGQTAVGHAGDEELDLRAVERAAVPLAAE